MTQYKTQQFAQLLRDKHLSWFINTFFFFFFLHCLKNKNSSYSITPMYCPALLVNLCFYEQTSFQSKKTLYLLLTRSSPAQVERQSVGQLILNLHQSICQLMVASFPAKFWKALHHAAGWWYLVWWNKKREKELTLHSQWGFCRCCLELQDRLHKPLKVRPEILVLPSRLHAKECFLFPTGEDEKQTSMSYLNLQKYRHKDVKIKWILQGERN